jgi:hypothetical protein
MFWISSFCLGHGQEPQLNLNTIVHTVQFEYWVNCNLGTVSRLISTMQSSTFFSWNFTSDSWATGPSSATLVGRFKFFSTIYGEKCCLFFTYFSPKKVVKNSKQFTILWVWGEKFKRKLKRGEKYLNFSPLFSVKNVWKTNNIFHYKLCWKSWISQPVLTVDILARWFEHCLKLGRTVFNWVKLSWAALSWVEWTSREPSGNPRGVVSLSVMDSDCADQRQVFRMWIEVSASGAGMIN